MRNGPYELVLAPDTYPGKKYRGKYVYKHHLVWWEHTGQLVPVGFLIHHKNENKLDNRFDNLELKSRSSHSTEHNKERGEQVTIICGWCKEKFLKPRHLYNQGLKQSRSGELFCCKSHQVRFQQAQRKR